MHDERMETLAGMMAQTSPRLDNIEKSVARIENTLVDLSKAMVSIARVEERLANSADHVSHLNSKVANLEGQIQGLLEANSKRDREVMQANAVQDIRAAERDQKVIWMERAAWLVFAAGVSFVVSKFKVFV